jgi:hypothetical protein
MKKSPAEDTPGQSLEQIFQNGFAGAESTPPPRLWDNVERELENQDLHRYRRQVIWYRLVAAACLLLLLSGGVVLWKRNLAFTSQETPLATQTETKAEDVPPSDRSTTPTVTPEAEVTATEPLLDQTAVSEAFSRKQGQTKPVASASQVLAAHGKEVPAKQAAVPLPEPDVVKKRAASTVVVSADLAQNGSETSVGNSVAFQETGDGKQENKSFGVAEVAKGRALINQLAATASTPVITDSLLAHKPKSILVQKESPAAALAEAAASAGKTAQEAGGLANKWSVSLAYSPQYAYAPVKVGQNTSRMSFDAATGQTQNSQFYHQAVEEYNSSYSPAYSFAAMVGAEYQLNEKWQLESGVLYTQNEATTTHSYLIYGGGNGFANQSGNHFSIGNSNRSIPLVSGAFNADAGQRGVYVSPTEEYQTKYRYQQVGLPLRLTYKWKIKKLYALLSGGVNLNLLVQSSIAPETPQVEAVTYTLSDGDSPFKAFQWATATSVGVGYDVSDKMSIFAAPELTYSLSSLVHDGQQQVNPYQLGLRIGGKWRLSK